MNLCEAPKHERRDKRGVRSCIAGAIGYFFSGQYTSNSPFSVNALATPLL